MLALVLACLLTLLLATAIGWQMLEAVRVHFGTAYVSQYTLLNAQKMLAPIQRELALARRLADSVLLREWLRDEQDPHKRALAFREAEGFRRDFREHSYFIASQDSLGFFLNQPDMDYSEAPRYVMDPESQDDGWFFSTLESGEPFNINVNPDRVVFTKIWFNVVVQDDDEVLGVAGSGLDLTNFIDEFIKADAPGVTPIIIDQNGAIKAHPDQSLISLGAGSGAIHQIHWLDALLEKPEQRAELHEAMRRTKAQEATVEAFGVMLDGHHQLMALAYLPELQWFVVTAVDLEQANLLEGRWFWITIVLLLLLLMILLGTFLLAVERIVLQPVRHLQQSANALAEGDYAVNLPPPGRDELGDLSRAFATMARQIKRHTDELEGKVQARTKTLEATNRMMAKAQKQISDSIDYASLIQRALLPDSQLARVLGPRHCVVWHPRDVVGGDFYVFRGDADRHLIGIIDCAGHGVSGALMTMLARAAFDDAMNRCGIESPATLLHHADSHLREMLGQSQLPRAIATNMDVGLAYVDRRLGLVRYAGAKLSLYWSDGDRVDEIAGGKRALFDRRVGRYRDSELRLSSEVTYYLVTDGYLDQAGGENGFGFGGRRFNELLREYARLPLEQQAEALNQTLHDYRGTLPQRDDITFLAFRLN